MLQKTVKVGDKDVTFRSSATIPRLYRMKFRRDIFKDLSKLEQSYKDKGDGTGEMEIEDLEIFENVAYIMAFHADPTIPGTIDEWLDSSRCFPFMRSCLRFWNCGAATSSRMYPLKKTARHRKGADDTIVFTSMRGGRDQHF